MQTENTAQLLRPHQLGDMTEEKDRLENMLNGPSHIRSQIQDRGEVSRQLRHIRRQLETQTPQPYKSKDKDDAVGRMKQLEGEIQEGMLTHEEMRKNPHGAVDHHRKWERANKAKILELKNIRLRMHASDDSPDKLEDERDVANIEDLRPAYRAGGLSMDGAQIPGKEYYMPPDVSPVAVMSEEQSKLLEEVDPKLHARMALLSNDQRADVLDLIDGLVADEKPENAKAKPGRPRKEA